MSHPLSPPTRRPSPRHAHPPLSPLHHRDFRPPQNENSFTIKKAQINLCRILVLGVLPAYKKTGAAGVLFFETAARAKRLGYRYGEASWILEDNVMMNRAAEVMRGHKYKTCRIYEKAITGLP